MADSFEDELHTMQVTITLIYAQLATVLHRLPIPVELPTHENVDLLREMDPAVRRAVEVMPEMPVDAKTKARVIIAATDWLTCTDLWVLSGINGPDRARALQWVTASGTARRNIQQLLEEGDAEYNPDQE